MRHSGFSPDARAQGGGISEASRHAAEKKGETLPGGRFPIRNDADLEKAKHAFGRSKPGTRAQVHNWIDERARDLGEPPLGGSVGKK